MDFYARIIHNLFYDTTSLHFEMHVPKEYKVYGAQVGLFNYYKHFVEFSPSDSGEKASISFPEIDGVTLLTFQEEEEELFTKLDKKGYTSEMMKLFVFQEKTKSPYYFPNSTTVVLKKKKLPTQTTCYGNANYRFHLDGGESLFQTILKRDPDFWPTLLKACDTEDFVKIHEIHLCSDLNRNLMPSVMTAIKNSHYVSMNLRMYGYYKIGDQYLKSHLGKRAKDTKLIASHDPQLLTLYVGSRNGSPISLAIYDKKEEQKAGKGFFVDEHTRIELRFANLKNDDKMENFLKALVVSYFVETGEVFRTKMFLDALTNTIRFTNHTRDKGFYDLAQWWSMMIILPLYHATVGFSLKEFADIVYSGNAPKAISGEVPKAQKKGRPKGSVDKRPKYCKSNPKPLKTDT